MNNSFYSRYKYIIFLCAIVLLILGVVFVYFTKTQTVKIVFKNTKEVEIYNRHEVDSGRSNPTPIQKITKNNTETRLLKGEYVLHFIAKSSYEGKYQYVTLSDNHQDISFTPSLSEEKLKEMLNEEYSEINSTIQRDVINIKNYQLQEGYLLEDGTWYISAMKYIGNDYRNFDSLRILMHKKSGVWSVVTPGPSLQYNYDQNRSIPRSIIDSVNDLETPDFNTSFTRPATHNTL